MDDPTHAPGRPAGIQSYLSALERKHGRSVEDWFTILDGHRDLRHMEMVQLLKTDFGVGHGHANALVATYRSERGL